MKKIWIDGTKIEDKAELFRAFREQLETELTFGDNLDALYDALTELREPIEIEISEPGALQETLGAYADRFLRMLRDYYAGQDTEI